jgi:hypothetical protein
MKKLLPILAIFVVLTIVSSCSVFRWVDNKTDEWGQSMPVSNEQRRCANAFCSEASYLKNAQPNSQQNSGQYAPKTMPIVPIPQVQQMDPAAPQMYSPQMPATQISGQQMAQYAPAAMPTSVMQPPAMPSSGKMLTPDEFMAMQKAGGGALPNEDEIGAVGPLGQPDPYVEAGRDPRLKPNEANPDWKKDLPPVPQEMQSMRGLQ